MHLIGHRTVFKYSYKELVLNLFDGNIMLNDIMNAIC